MKSMTSWRLTQVVIWALICATVAPPAVLAQTMMRPAPGATAVPFGQSPAGQLGSSSTQPIYQGERDRLATPEALRPIMPSQAPCPVQSQSEGSAFGMTSGQSANQSAGGSPQDGTAAPAPRAGPTTGLAISKNSGLLSPLVQGQQDESQGNVGAALSGQVETSGQLSIEEAFYLGFPLLCFRDRCGQHGGDAE